MATVQATVRASPPSLSFPVVPGRTVAQLAAKIGCSEKQALALLRQLEAAGLVVQGEEGWRLSAEAERLYGRALRAMDAWLAELAAEAA